MTPEQLEEVELKRQAEMEEQRRQAHVLVAETIKRSLAESASLALLYLDVYSLPLVCRGSQGNFPRRRRYRRNRLCARIRGLETERINSHQA